MAAKTNDDRPEVLRSRSDLCEVGLHAPKGHDGVPDLLIEIPHGATRAAHFDAWRKRLVGELPDDLIQFFFVNTDVGAPECAASIAETVRSVTPESGIADWLDDPSMAARPRSVLTVRSLVPRTFIDCNRVIEPVQDATAADYRRTGVTKGLPDYIRDDADGRLLRQAHDDYVEIATAAYDWICGNGGRALTLHTYAPRSIRIDSFDHGIVAALHEAYEPERFATWPQRPDVDLITEAEDGVRLAPQAMVEATMRYYAKIGIEPTENVSYRLHPSTMGERFSRKYPQQVLCAEISRGLLARPFTPFEEMTIGPARAARLSAPLAAACLTELANVR